MSLRLASITIFVLISLATLMPISQAWAEKRIALVIGNGAYPNIGELVNPPNDARLIAGTLRQLGFEVIEEINVDQKSMKKAIKKFGDRLNDAGKKAVGLFYYAGHGVQVNGENYLIPVNVDISDEADVDIEAVSMRAVIQNMSYAGNNMNIIVMDACRNNPFKRSFRSTSRGLARMEASKGTLVAYATAPGDVAADGSGMNSPYTLALSTNMMKPGLTVERMFKEVRNDVVQSTNSVQVPWESSSLTGSDFYFNGGATSSGALSTVQSSIQSKDVLFWQSVQNSTSVVDFETYLSQYPNGVFALLAQVKIDQLNSDSATVNNVEVAATRLTGFKTGKFKPRVISATGPCQQVSIKRMKSTGDKLTGAWTHPEANGRIKLYFENDMIAVKWSGSEIRSSREIVQINGSDVTVDIKLRHSAGSCKVFFKLTDVLE